MVPLLVLFAVPLTAGLFFILADALRMPTLGAAKAMLNAGEREKKASKALDAYLTTAAVKLSKFIRMDEYKKIRMKNVLSAVGYSMTPEVYTAYAIVKAAAVFLCAILCLFLFPLLSILIIFLAVLIYFKEIREADEQLRSKREQIESELPRFVATIEQTLKSSRDVLSLMERYKKNAGPEFSHELDVLTADMRSSSYEAALVRFEARLQLAHAFRRCARAHRRTPGR